MVCVGAEIVSYGQSNVKLLPKANYSKINLTFIIVKSLNNVILIRFFGGGEIMAVASFA